LKNPIEEVFREKPEKKKRKKPQKPLTQYKLRVVEMFDKQELTDINELIERFKTQYSRSKRSPAVLRFINRIDKIQQKILSKL
jgi:hypothetical protein